MSSSGGYFRLPGGKPEKEEASIQAAIRELREETGLRAYDVRYLFNFDFFEPGKQMEVKVSHDTRKILEMY